jgi:hypothetical protein
MQKWEYKITALMGEKEMNELGSQGWELVAILAVNYQGSSTGLIFKRRISD